MCESMADSVGSGANGNELWKLVVVRSLFARCGSSSCLVSPAVVGQQCDHCEGSVFYFKKRWKIVMMRPRLIEVMAPSLLGVSDLKMASLLSSQASRKLSCAVLEYWWFSRQKRQLTCQCQVTYRTFSAICALFRILMGYACALCIFAGPVYHRLGYPLVPPLLHMLNLCVGDNLDGFVTRHIGQCMKFG